MGETLVCEDRLWNQWADWLGVGRGTFFAALGAVIERGEHHRRVFELVRPGFDLDAERQARRDRGVAEDLVSADDLYPDVTHCLTALHGRGYRIGIAGNQPARSEAVFAALGLPVDFIASSERWGVEKPSPQFFARLAAEAGRPASAVAYVGDRLDNDMLPALAAGMTAIFVRRGPWGVIHSSRPEMAAVRHRIHTLGELPDLLDRL